MDGPLAMLGLIHEKWRVEDPFLSFLGELVVTTQKYLYVFAHKYDMCSHTHMIHFSHLAGRRRPGEGRVPGQKSTDSSEPR